MSTTESELVRRSRAGSAAAFEVLVRSNEAAALAVARGFLGDADEAADAVQDAFVRAYATLHRLHAGSAFGPWFRTILRNLCLDRLRVAARRPGAAWTPGVVDAHAWNEASALREVERSELAAAVQAALGDLSADQRAVLVLKELEGLGYAEIAHALGIPEGTVASRLHHARVSLRGVLRARGITLEDVEP